MDQNLGRTAWSGGKRHSGTAHRTKKEKKYMSHCDKFVTEGNEKADELAKAGAMLDEGFMAEARAKAAQQEREEVYAALQYAASFHCLVEEWKGLQELSSHSRKKSGSSWTKKSEETKHRTEWCSDAEARKMYRIKILVQKFGKLEQTTFGRSRLDRQGKVLIWCRKCSGYARQRTGLKQLNCCKLEPMGTQGYGRMLKRIQVLEDGGSKQRMQEAEVQEDKRELLREKSVGGF